MALALAEGLEARIADPIRTAVDAAGERLASEAIQAARLNALAVGHLLGGDPDAAAYAGSRALVAAWRPLYVANLGVYLVHLGRHDDAMVLFACARAMRFTTAALFEAIAAAEHRRGNASAAVAAIEEAAHLAPYDAAIAAERVLLTGDADPGPPDDPLARFAAERLALARHVRDALSAPARELHAAETAAGFAYDQRRDEWLEQRLEIPRRVLNDVDWRERAEGPTHLYDPYNHTLLSFALDNIYLTDLMLRATRDLALNNEWTFWAEVLEMPERAYARELLQEARAIDRRAPEEPLRSLYKRMNFGNVAMLFERHLQDFQDSVDAADDVRFELGGGREGEQAYCRLWRAAFEHLRAAAQVRLRPRLKNFDRVAAGYLLWAHRLIEESKDYARRTIAVRRPHDKEEARESEERIIETIADYYAADGSLMHHVHHFVQSQRYIYDRHATLYRELMLPESGSRFEVPRACEDVDRPTTLDELSQEKLEALLAELEAAMREDLNAETEFAPSCEISIGVFSASVDHNGQVSRGAGSVAIASRGSRFAGATIATGYGLSGGQGLVGKGGVSLVARYDPEKDEWDALAQATGSLGVGLTVPRIGGGACYPGSAKVTLNARAFIEHERLMHQVRARLDR